MDLLRTCCALLIVRFASGAQYIIRVDQYNFNPVDRELVIGQGSLIEQEGNRSYVSGHLMFSRNVHEVTMFASLDMLRPKSRRVRLFENKLEFCTFSANAYKSKFLRQLYHNYVSYLNTPPICPLKANFNYTLNRAYVDDRSLPDFLPECSYVMKVHFQHKSKPMADMIFSGHISPVARKRISLGSGAKH